MHFKKLDLNLLVALDSLLKKRSVTETAEELKLSPSTVSSSLSRLRDYFDDDLLTKVGRKMEVTPLGESLQDPVRDILNRIDSTILLKPEFEADKTDRTFSLFISDYSQIVLLPHLLGLAEKQQCTAKYKLLRQVHTSHKALQTGDADLLMLPEKFLSPEYPYQYLFSEDFVCLLWRDSELAKADFTKEAYRNARHAVMTLADDKMDHISLELRELHKVERQIALNTYSLSALPSLLVNTNLVATVHTRVANIMIEFLPLVKRPLPFEIGPIRQCIQWHHYRTNDPGLIWLRTSLKSAVREMDNL